MEKESQKNKQTNTLAKNVDIKLDFVFFKVVELLYNKEDNW